MGNFLDKILYTALNGIRKPNDHEPVLDKRQVIFSNVEFSKKGEMEVLVRKYHQMSDSQLVVDLQEMFNLSDARYCARRSCKVLTFWMEAYLKGMMHLRYIEYFKSIVEKGYVSPVRDAFLKKDLDELAGHFGFGINTIRDYSVLKEYNRDEPWYGTLRFRPNGGWHSMLIFNEPTIGLKVADTGNRKFDTDVFKYLTRQNFEYVTILS